jgi:amidohydrolase
MIEDGVMENPHVDGAFGIHLWTPLKVGTIGIRSGVMMATVSEFNIELIGKGGHGAYPHLSVDPIVAAAQLVMSLQTIVSRETDPLDTIVVTVGKLASGDVFNVIPEKALLVGTVRGMKEGTHREMRRKMKRIIKGISDAFRVKYKFDYIEGYPVLINDKDMVKMVEEVGRKVVGKRNVIEVQPSMGAEDMAYYLQKAKGAFYFVGASNKAKGITAPHHSPHFNIDEDALPIGVEMHIRTALSFLTS